MKFRPLVLALAAVCAAPSLPGADIQANYWYQSTITSDVNGPLDLLAELNYDDAQANAPIVVVMHGYSPATGNLVNVRAAAQRLRDKGFFAISVAMRGRDGSDGVRDSGGLEIYDIYDAVESVKADPSYAGLIDPANIHITGYSGGGGNTMSALTKFPDYFRVGASFYGMSDYGYDLDYGWYNNGAGSRASQLRTDIGNPNTGDPTVLDRYLARASNFASKNNPYSEIHLFVNNNETICPPWNDTSYRDNAVAAASVSGEFDNITVHIGGLGVYEDFNNNSINDANELQSWQHGGLNANSQDAGELWYRDRLLAGSIPQPVLNDNDELYVAGYVKTSSFDCWLGDGQNAAGNLTYALSDTLMSFSLALVSSDLSATGDFSIDTARMSGREVLVEVNDVAVDTFSGGGTYEYSALGQNDTLELVDNGPDTNASPTLTTFAGVVKTTSQNTEVEITFAELAAQGDEMDSDGTVTAFVVQAVSNGTLKIGSTAGSATAFSVGGNDTVDATTSAYWTPAPGVTGSSVEAFTVVVEDDDNAISSPPVGVPVAVSGASGSGSLSGTFTAVTQGDNDDFDLTTLGSLDWAYWHEFNSNSSEQGDGSVLPANRKDGSSLISNMFGSGTLRGSSTGNKTAHDFTFTDGTSPTADTVDDQIGILAYPGDYVQLTITLPTTDEHTVYLWVAAQETGAPELTASLSGATDYTDSSLSGPKESGVWSSGYYILTVTPANANDVLTLRYDKGASVYGVIAGVAVSPAGASNTPPTLSAFAGPVDSTAQDTEVELSFTELAAQGDEADVDGSVDAFVVQAVSSGTLKLGTDAGSATAFATGTNDTVDASTNAYWTPAPGVTGSSVEAFTVVVEDDDSAISSPPVGVPVAVSGASGSASLSGTFTVVTEGVNDGFNVTTLGGLDWAYWHESSNSITGPRVATNSKSGATLIGDVSVVNGSSLRGTTSNNTVHDFAFSDGVSPADGNQDNVKGILNADLANDDRGVQLSITIPTAETHTVYLWVAAQQATGVLTATLTGATDFTDSSLVAGSSVPNWNSGVYTLSVTPATAGDVLNLQYVSSNGSGNRYAILAGAAVLASGTAGNTYADWIAGKPGIGGQTGLNDDPDGDGIDNGVENFFGTAPGEFSQGLVAGTLDTGAGTFTFTHPLNPNPADDLTATYRWSTDLAAFQPGGASNGAGTTTVTFAQGEPSGGMVTVTATVSGSVFPDRLFVGVEVTEE